MRAGPRMKPGDLVLICPTHASPWIPTKHPASWCGAIHIDYIGKHEDLSRWDEYSAQMAKGKLSVSSHLE